MIGWLRSKTIELILADSKNKTNHSIYADWFEVSQLFHMNHLYL